MINPVVYAKLVQAAKARRTIAFGDLGKAADLLPERDDDARILALVLDNISDQEIAEGRPLLPVVVVHEGTQLPGPGVFAYAKRKNLQTTDDRTYFASELKRVYDHWAP